MAAGDVKNFYSRISPFVVQNTNTETNLLSPAIVHGSNTIAGRTLQTGDVIRVTATGTLQATYGQQSSLTFKIYLDGAASLFGFGVTIPANGGTSPFMLQYLMTVRSATYDTEPHLADIELNGVFWFCGALAKNYALGPANNNNNVDPTASHNIEVSATFSVADPGLKLTVDQALIEYLTSA